MLFDNPSSTDFARARPERSTSFQMPVFRPGVEVMQEGRREVVSHIVLRRREMMVYLVGKEDPVKPEHLKLTPSWFSTARKPEALTWYL